MSLFTMRHGSADPVVASTPSAQQSSAQQLSAQQCGNGAAESV
ncbi:hypothetical protein [Streptomyces smyrnaeus]